MQFINTETHYLIGKVSQKTLLACAYLVHFQHHGSSVQRLSAKHTTERAVILQAHLLHDGIHRPAVQLFIRHDLQRQLILLLVPFHRLQGIVSVTRDALIHRQQQKVQPVIVALVQDLHHMGQDGGVLPTRGTDGHGLPAIKESSRHDGLMDLLLESPEEAVLTEGVSSLGPLEHGPSLNAVTALDGHDDTAEHFRVISELNSSKHSLN